ncbi:MAG: glycoside hydrolase family 28 protein, partial [Planctomycetota bacterium]
MSARSLCVLATAVLAGFTIASRSSNAAEARYDVTAYGAKADGTTLDTAAIQAAIDACAEAGGGRVVLPKGRFLSGSLALKSGVRLVIEPEATLVGSRSLDDYPTRRLIRAEDATDIGIEGGGTIDGQGQSFWQKRERTSARPTYRKTAQFDYEPLPRPSFIHFVRCRNVVVHNVRLQNSPAWTVHLQRCQKARMEKVVIRNPLYGPNTDGIDINSCIDVEVRGCDIITGDDGVVLKSTEPGHDHPSRNITVEDCRIWSACNTLKIGTETHDRFENIVFRNCHLYCDSD